MTTRLRGIFGWMWRWTRRLAYLVLTLVLLFAVLAWLGVMDRWARSAIVTRVERMTGGQVELESFRFSWWSLRAEMQGFVVRGREPEGTPPLFRADRLMVDLRVDSLLGRRVSLDEILLVGPQIHIRFDDAGQSNVPQPPTPAATPGKPLRERIFDLVIRKVRIENGEILYNNTRTPLVAEGGEFRFAFDHHAEAGGRRYYTGDFAWREVVIAARRYLPFTADVAARFTLARENFTLDEFRFTTPGIELTASAALASFTEPAWDFRYDGRLALDSLRTILRKPRSPTGNVRFHGQGDRKSVV